MNDIGRKIFATGVSGFLCGELAERILEEEENSMIYALARPAKTGRDKGGKSAAEKIRERFDWAIRSGRLRIFEGDLTNPLVITNPEDRNHVINNSTTFYHIGGNVDFNAPLEVVRRVNVEGTRNILNLAKECPNLSGGVHIAGTAYTNPIGGNKILLEDVLEERSGGFGCPYEQSKYEAELNIRRAIAQKELNCVVSLYKPSIIIGHSGKISVIETDLSKLFNTGGLQMTFGAYFTALVKSFISKSYDGTRQEKIRQFLADFESGRTRTVRLVGYPDTLKSFICVDHAANEIYNLSTRTNPSDMIFHVTGEPITGNDVANAIHNTVPPITVQYVGSIVNKPSDVEDLINRTTRPFLYYNTRSDRFDRRNTLEHLKERYSSRKMTPSLFTSVTNRFFKYDLLPALKREITSPSRD